MSMGYNAITVKFPQANARWKPTFTGAGVGGDVDCNKKEKKEEQK